MAQQISMTPSEMRAGAKKAKTTANTLENQVIREMDNLLSNLERTWKGEAIGGYRERYNKIKGSLRNGVQLLTEIHDNLNTTAQIMEETDQRIASQYKK